MEGNPMRRACRVALGLTLLSVAAFCVFGFLATYEPTDRPDTALTFRIGYAAIGLGCLAGAVALVVGTFKGKDDSQ